MELGPDSGKIISRKRLLEARDTVTWENCWVTSVGHRLVAVMGGAVFCLNPDCELLWFRQDPGTPLAIGLHHEQPALVVGDRLYLTDPVKGTIECIELESGVLHWRKTVPGLWRILQPAGDRLIVQTGDAILSLRGDTGQPVWRHVSHGMLDGFLQSGPDGLLLYAERDQQTPGDWCPALVWLDVKTGDVRAAGRLSGLHGSWVGAGPLVACDGRLWCFAAVQGPTAPTAYGPPLPERNICELVREGPAKPAGR
jgi:outer membrane protein assembly factor BamB